MYLSKGTRLRLFSRAASYKILFDKAFNIATSPKYEGYQCELALVVYKCVDKKESGRAIKMKLSLIRN